MDINSLYSVFLESSGVSTDTRTLKKGEIYFALTGENFDGSRFVEQALQKGASYAVTSNTLYNNKPHVLVVENPLMVLQELARYHRLKWDGQLLAITGSNGKTTTKELIAAVLLKKYNVLYTEGNLNNHIGVPLTLLGLKDQEIAVVEMGANHQGEIAALCEIARPDAGLITNIGKAHLEGFGGMEGVKKGKGELYDFLSKNDKPVFLNADDPVLREMALARSLDTITYGTSGDLMVSGLLEQESPSIVGSFSFQTEEESIKSSLFGKYNFLNILAATCVGTYFEVEAKDISAAVGAYVPENNRSQVLHGKTNEIILDAYNANPSSMLLSLSEFLNRSARSQKMLILGDMLELGAYAEEEHKSIVDFLSGIKPAPIVLLVGDLFYSLKSSGDYSFHFFKSTGECMDYLERHKPGNSLIFLKGSRKISLEATTNLLLQC